MYQSKHATLNISRLLPTKSRDWLWPFVGSRSAVCDGDRSYVIIHGKGICDRMRYMWSHASHVITCVACDASHASLLSHMRFSRPTDADTPPRPLCSGSSTIWTPAWSRDPRASSCHWISPPLSTRSTLTNCCCDWSPISECAGWRRPGFGRISLADHATWPSGISGQMSGAAILAFLREASSDLSSSMPSYPPSQGSWSPHGIRFINTRTILNSTRRSAPWFRLNGGSLTMFPGVDVLVPRQLASIELNQVRGHYPWLMAGSFQAGARRLVDIGDGHVEVKDEIKILGVHLDPTLSMNTQVKSLIKTSNFHIRALRHIRRGLTFESAKMIALVSSLLDSIIVTLSCMAPQRRTSADSSVSRAISRELCCRLHGLPVQCLCSNTYTGFRSSRG